MYPQAEVQNTLENCLAYVCSNEDCGHSELQEQGDDNYLIERNSLVAENEQGLPDEYIRRGLKDDPTLFKEKSRCGDPECTGREARLLHLSKGDDAGLEQFLICCECARITKKD